jgi:hypothetical protein
MIGRNDVHELGLLSVMINSLFGFGISSRNTASSTLLEFDIVM